MTNAARHTANRPSREAGGRPTRATKQRTAHVPPPTVLDFVTRSSRLPRPPKSPPLPGRRSALPVQLPALPTVEVEVDVPSLPPLPVELPKLPVELPKPVSPVLPITVP